ncbi:MAG: hypothetical protein NT085_01330 [candidate division SR1 bacterium]|nr:hypothetical protein [candidate division SR1 bacterium]
MKAKKNRTILVNKPMNDMVIGEKAFFDGDGIYLIHGKCYVDTNFSVSPKKNEIHTVPIERIGPEKGDFELDFFTIEIFYPKFITQQIYNMLHDDAVMLVEDVEMEVYDPSNYRTKMFPRMDWGELIENLIANNEVLDVKPDDKTSMEDKQALRECIKKKLSEFDLSELRTYEKEFTGPTQEEKAEGRVNFVADENILRYIIKRIVILEEEQAVTQGKKAELIKDKALTDMSMDELNTALAESKATEDFERSALIRDEMKTRPKVMN